MMKPGKPNQPIARPEEPTKRDVIAAIFYGIRLWAVAAREVRPVDLLGLDAKDLAQVAESDRQCREVYVQRSVADADALIKALAVVE